MRQDIVLRDLTAHLYDQARLESEADKLENLRAEIFGNLVEDFDGFETLIADASATLGWSTALFSLFRAWVTNDRAALVFAVDLFCHEIQSNAQDLAHRRADQIKAEAKEAAATDRWLDQQGAR